MLSAGDVIAGEFEIVRPLGDGGMGSVFLAHQRSTDAYRALKVMHPEWARNPQLLERFAQEARACGRIESEHVVEVLHFGFDEGRRTPWLVMEYLPGETLEQRVRRLGSPQGRELRQILEQLFHGVIAAHRAGVVHRDLKPQNIYVSAAQRADVAFTIKVLDFGIAKLLGSGRSHTLAMGTKAWMAPEQEQSGAVITEAADVWALGLITFWLATGHSFWRNARGNDSDLSYEIFFETVAAASTRALEVGRSGCLPWGFDEWFARCVQRDPQHRYPSASSCWQALAQVLSGDEQTPLLRSDELAVTAPASSVGLTGGGHSPPSTIAPTADTLAAEPAPKPSRSSLRWLGASSLGAFLGAATVAMPAVGGLEAGVRWMDLASLPWLDGAHSTDVVRSAVAQPMVPRSSNDGVVETASLRAAAHPVNTAASSEQSAGAPTTSEGVASMVYVAAGAFTMGVDDGLERHRPHSVTLTHAYFIDQREVSVREYGECVAAGRCSPNGVHGGRNDAATLDRLRPYCNLTTEGDRQRDPVNCVDWYQATAYCAFRGKRLPTEAEWEYAARGGDGRLYPWGHAPPRSCDESVVSGLCDQRRGTYPVASRNASSASPFGALDMSGNVWEWVVDAWDSRAYDRQHAIDPVVESTSARGVLRGGGWDYSGDRATLAYRLPFDRAQGNVSTGIRCALSAP